MKIHRLIFLIVALTLLSACELHMAPSEYWSKLFRTQTDSRYYMDKSENLTDKIATDIEEYEINRISIMDFVDEDGRVPILGEYLATRVVEAFTRRSLFHDRSLRVAQKGEVNEVLRQLNLKHAYLYARNDLKDLGESLQSQAVLTGRITDLGTNIDMHLTLTDVVTGEVISSATEHLTRTKFAVEMLRQH